MTAVHARCAYYERCGPAREVLALGEMPVRAPAAGEVLVRLRFSGINPTDIKNRGGAPGRGMAFDRIVPHHDGVGTVEATGEGVPTTLVGKPVWVFCAQHKRAFGTASEYITIDRQLVVPLPSNTSFEAGACLGIPAMTAWNAVLGSGPVNGRIVLVTGGAGAVGHYAVQIARRNGALVVATVSSKEKAQDALQGGAHYAIDYRQPHAAEQILAATDGRGIDLCVDVDTTTNATLVSSVMAMGGQISSYGSRALMADIPVRDLRLRCISMRFLTLYHFNTDVLQSIAAGINAMLEANLLQHRIARIFPIGDIAAAHEAVESGAVRGKVLLDVAA
jgi:NADPH2:quinone reductase